MEPLVSTQEATLAVGRALGHPLSPQQVDTLIRAWPADRIPRVVGRHRRWTPEDVERLRRAVAERFGLVLEGQSTVSV